MRKISVITVCRNCIENLRRTVESTSRQNGCEFEHIIVDGASTDGTVEFLKSGFSGIWVSEPDKGIYDAMNKGVVLSSGDWVIFMNAGDYFTTEDTLSRLSESIEKEEADVIYGDVLKMGRNGMLYRKKAETPHNSHRMIFCHQSAVCRRNLLVEHPFDTRHLYSADFKFFKTLMKNKMRFSKVEYPVAVFDTSGVSNRSRSAGLADNIRVIIETDGAIAGLPHLLHILPTYLLCKLRGK